MFARHEPVPVAGAGRGLARQPSGAATLRGRSGGGFAAAARYGRPRNVSTGGNMDVRMRRGIALVAGVVLALGTLLAVPAGAHRSPPPVPGDRARYILPPGNYGGLPTTANSLDQLPLYDALTPLRGNVTDADIDQLFLPEDFKPIGATREEPTRRPGTKILYD